ncbi:MAG TPA: hypothetical protein EYP36_03780 [Calditrichaeota bacterium]|nr:hypothetical protein [Calditrichota bacterium]
MNTSKRNQTEHVLPINIDELAFVLHRGPGLEMECFLNLDTGAIINIPTNRKFLKRILKIDVEMLRDDALINMLLPENGHFLYIPNQFSLRLYELFSSFAKKIETTYPEIHDRLWVLIQKNGTYSEYKNIFSKVSSLNAYFIRFRDDLYEKYAIRWLEENNITYVLVKNPSSQ